MSVEVWLGFLLAATIGACARFLIDTYVTVRVGGPFPWGTGVINISGSFVLGVITGAVLYHAVSPEVRFVLGTGFCGAYTTFSTMQLELLKMVDHHRYGLAAGYTVASVAGGYFLVFAATALVRRVRVIA